MRRLIGMMLLSIAACTTAAARPPKEAPERQKTPAPSLAVANAKDAKAGPAQPMDLVPHGKSARNFEAALLAGRSAEEKPDSTAAYSLDGVAVGSGGSGARSDGPVLAMRMRVPAPAAPPPPADREPRSAGLKAGSSDDNLQFNAFLDFLAKKGSNALPLNVSDRVVVEVTDASGLPVPDALITVRDEGHAMLTRRTYADGRALLFPSAESRLHSPTALLRVEALGTSRELPFAQSPHRLQIQLEAHRAEVERVPLDVAFVLDTTGSMGDEIARLKQTMQVIHFQLSHLEPRADVRFGMVMYKDRGDDKITEVVPFTGDLDKFRAVLARVTASGGGDEPEDVQAGLHDAMRELQWRERGVRVAFLIGDAAPHLDYGETYTYLSAMQEAAERGIKFATIGCSGLPLTGEVVWRQIAQYTMGPYVFLSRGERGDMEGSVSTVSHHVGSNWIAENLEAIVVRMVKAEVANLNGRRVAQQDFFQASASGIQSGDAVLRDLFKQSLRQLADYSLEHLDEKTPTVLLHLQARGDGLQQKAKRLEARLESGLADAAPFKLVTQEQGRAQLAVSGQLSPGEEKGGQLELLVTLTRLETHETLSLSLLKIDPALLR